MTMMTASDILQHNIVDLYEIVRFQGESLRCRMSFLQSYVRSERCRKQVAANRCKLMYFIQLFSVL